MTPPPGAEGPSNSMTDVVRRRLTEEVKRVCRFLLIGCGGLAVDSSVYLWLDAHGAAPAVGRAVSLVAAGLVTWQANRRFTFAASGRRRREELGRYSLVALGAQGFNYSLFLGLSALAPQHHPLLLIFVSASAAAVISYLGQRLFTFGVAPFGSWRKIARAV